jgi:hypothetical protein
MLISIKEFAKTGNFGPVRTGMNRSQVTGFLGAPDDTWDDAIGNSGLLYGGYEFLFFDDALIIIQNDWVDLHHLDTVYWGNDCFKIDPWILAGKRGTSVAEILLVCREDGVECEIIEYYGRAGLRTKCGVVLDFGEPDGDGTLRAICFAP